MPSVQDVRENIMLCGSVVHKSTVSTVTNVNTQVSGGFHVLLQIMKVSVRGSKGTAEVNIRFDNGAHRSYISGDLAKKIATEWVGSLIICSLRFTHPFKDAELQYV